jgi:hypothetical protein
MFSYSFIILMYLYELILFQDFSQDFPIFTEIVKTKTTMDPYLFEFKSQFVLPVIFYVKKLLFILLAQ